MQNTIEEVISDEDRKSLLRIQKAINWRFSHLVSLSGLKPESDFRHLDLKDLDLRGEDLRGFDFTGSDLRGCIKDENTLIDHTTIFTDCDLDWIENPNPEITELMAKIQSAASNAEKRKLLQNLTQNYFSPDHTRLFIRGQLERTQSLETFIELSNFFELKTQSDQTVILQALQRIALNKARKKYTRGQNIYSASGFSDVIKKISESKNGFVSSIFANYLDKSQSFGRVSLNPTVFEVSGDLERFLEAIDQTAQATNKTLL